MRESMLSKIGGKTRNVVSRISESKIGKVIAFLNDEKTRDTISYLADICIVLLVGSYLISMFFWSILTFIRDFADALVESHERRREQANDYGREETVRRYRIKKTPFSYEEHTHFGSKK